MSDSLSNHLSHEQELNYQKRGIKMSEEPRKYLTICKNCGKNDYMASIQVICDECQEIGEDVLLVDQFCQTNNIDIETVIESLGKTSALTTENAELKAKLEEIRKDFEDIEFGEGIVHNCREIARKLKGKK